jgi:hypothetical protein
MNGTGGNNQTAKTNKRLGGEKIRCIIDMVVVVDSYSDENRYQMKEIIIATKMRVICGCFEVD